MVEFVPVEALDSVGMFPATFGLADQIEAAFATAEATRIAEPPGRIDNVIVLGMGGSGVAGDIAAAIAGPRLSVPLTVSKNYELPEFVGSGSLVLACSASGNTEETLNATSMALQRSASVVGITKGGALGELLSQNGASWVPMDPTIVQPRAGIGAVSVPVFSVLERLGLMEDSAALVQSAADQVRARLEENAAEVGPARVLARRIERTQPIVYGGGLLGAAAASRWKCQINENAKCPAYATPMPELCHNEICGWGQHGDVTRQVNTLVFLRHGFEHPQIDKRFRFVADYSAEAVADIHTVVAEGSTDLAQLFDLIVVGDLVSLWTAAEAGVDPGPVPILIELKDFLSR
jgi:glucose/mannose-6-phosphate isomerase